MWVEPDALLYFLSLITYIPNLLLQLFLWNSFVVFHYQEGPCGQEHESQLIEMCSEQGDENKLSTRNLFSIYFRERFDS